jgi:hypothetical protein
VTFQGPMAAPVPNRVKVFAGTTGVSKPPVTKSGAGVAYRPSRPLWS